MIEQLRKNAGHWVVALGMVLAGLLAGCQTGPTYSAAPQDTAGTTFHVGDSLTVSGLTPSGVPENFPPVTQRVSEDGTVNLPLIGSVTAVGKTAEQLQKDIHTRYVPKYFPDLSVIVKGDVAYVYVDGEVHAAGKVEYPGEMTIVKAITSAGGFTDFAKQTKVRLTRGNHTEIINVKRAVTDPKYDVPVYPGDKIHVPRRLF